MAIENDNITPVRNTLTREEIISLYMQYVLENERFPKTVFRFSKDNNLTEDQFYNHFGSLETLQQSVWELFFDNTLALLENSNDYNSFTNREKLLTFYFTFFEMLTANRSYILFALSEAGDISKYPGQLKGLRKKVKKYTADLIREKNDEKSSRLFRQPATIFSEAAWMQMLFILKFWKDDNSAGFEKTDIIIEKSINTAFDLFNNTPLERVVDLGKFLWKEKIN